MSLENFREEIENDSSNNYIQSLIALNGKCSEEILYNCLRDFYLIAYESEPINKDNGEISVHFTDCSINRAKQSFNNLMRNVNNDYSKEKVFAIVLNTYTMAASEQERNEKRINVRNNAVNGYGHVSTYYNLNDIPENIIDIIKGKFEI